jgi:hypothetical protein
MNSILAFVLLSSASLSNVENYCAEKLRNTWDEKLGTYKEDTKDWFFISKKTQLSFLVTRKLE